MRKSYFVKKKLSGEKRLMCQIKLFVEKKLSSVVIFLAVEITQVIDSIPWVRCASGNVSFALYCISLFASLCAPSLILSMLSFGGFLAECLPCYLQ